MVRKSLLKKKRIKSEDTFFGVFEVKEQHCFVGKSSVIKYLGALAIFCLPFLNICGSIGSLGVASQREPKNEDTFLGISSLRKVLFGRKISIVCKYLGAFAIFCHLF